MMSDLQTLHAAGDVKLFDGSASTIVIGGDSFSRQLFDKTLKPSTHFGYHFVEHNGVLVDKTLSEDSCRPLAVAYAKEEVAAPAILKQLDTALLSLPTQQIHGFEHRMVQLPLSGGTVISHALLFILSADYKMTTLALGLGTGAASSTHFWAWNRELQQSQMKDCSPLDFNSSIALLQHYAHTLGICHSPPCQRHKL